jgi:hypothetical protein
MNNPDEIFVLVEGDGRVSRSKSWSKHNLRVYSSLGRAKAALKTGRFDKPVRLAKYQFVEEVPNE